MDQNLKKEVDALISSGYSQVQIKQALTQKGYTIPQIEEAINTKAQPKRKIGPKTMISVVSVLLILIIVTFYIMSRSGPTIIEYSEKPEDWIVDKGDNLKEIDVNLVTSGNSFVDSQGQQYRAYNTSTMFFSYGYYQGNYFDKEYFTNNDNLMSINNEMNPKDGVIEGYAVFKIVNESPVFYIFVDEDWKQKIIPIRIVYGFEHSKIKEFEFNEISEGIYMDTIIDDKDNYDEDYKFHLNSILVGDITDEKIASESNNLTMIVIK